VEWHSDIDTDMRRGVLYALLAAVLFGASTPFAKLLLTDTPPVLLAGLLYGGSGMGLGIWLGVRGRLQPHRRPPSVPWRRSEILCFGGAVAAGGVLGPAMLMAGLQRMPASTAALLLNMEGVFSALLAWLVFRENIDRRILIGILAIIAGGVLLAWPQRVALGGGGGAAWVAVACACWAMDNNLTRKVSAADPVVIAALKGLIAGAVDLGIAAALGAHWPAGPRILAAALVGLAGYGVSLALFVLALRHLGAARTGAYFSTAPFIGVAASLLLFRQMPGMIFWIAALLMGAGVGLHLTENHAHPHIHSRMRHVHTHVHDQHHQHEHDFEWVGREPHRHEHFHLPLTHSHVHYPDIHHRHEH
jgi:drug/metabolite transporter (DMT)-like permease